MGDTLMTDVSVQPVERDIAFDAVRRGLPAVAALVVVAGLIWGLDGALSATFGAGLAVANLIAAALSLGWAARISPTMLMGVALFGYLGRLGVITVGVLLVVNTAWVDVMALGLALVVTHLGLLIWEARFVSMSLAHPGLKPNKEKV